MPRKAPPPDRGPKPAPLSANPKEAGPHKRLRILLLAKWHGLIGASWPINPATTNPSRLRYAVLMPGQTLKPGENPPYLESKEVFPTINGLALATRDPEVIAEFAYRDGLPH